MSESPLNLLSLVNRQDIPTPEALLQHVLPQFVAAFPQITVATVYRLARGGLSVWASSQTTEKLGAYTALDDDSLYRQVLSTGIAYAEKQRLIIPLIGQGEVFALLVLLANAQIALLDVEAYSKQIALILHNHQLQQLLHRQIAATDKLNQAASLREVATALAENIIEKGQFIAINLFDYSPQGEVIGARAALTANREKSYTPDDAIGVDIDYWQTVIAALRQDGEFFISDVPSDDRLQSSGKSWLASRHIRSIYNLPLKVQGNLYGFISLIDTQRSFAMTPSERQIFRNLVQQSAAVIERSRLLERAQASLMESQILYSMTRALLQAEDVPDILRVLHQHVGSDTRTLSMSEYAYEDDGTLKRVAIRYLITKQGDVREVNIPWVEQMTPEMIETAYHYMHKVGENLEIIPDYALEMEEMPILRVLYQQGIGSSITIPLYENQRRTRQITLAWSKPNAYNPKLPQIMETAQSQIRLVLRNRSLLLESQRSAATSIEQAQLLQTLNELIISTNREQDEQHLLDTTAKVLYEITDADHIGIGIITNESDSTFIAAEEPSTGIKGQYIEGYKGGIPQRLREQNGTVIVPDVANTDFIDEEGRKALDIVGTKSVFFVPLFDLQNQLMGSVGFDYYEPTEYFNPRIIETAETIVSQVAVNLQKLRLLKTSQKQAQKMQEITEFSQSMLASLQAKDILQIALSTSQAILGADYISILLYDRAADHLRQVGELWDAHNTVQLPGLTLPENLDTIALDVWKSRQSVNIDSLQANWNWKHPYTTHLQSIMASPMISGGVALGVMEVGSKKINAFEKTDLAAFQQMSNQVAVALSNAEAYAQSQKLARNKVQANEIIAQLQRQTDVNAILNVTALELGKALGAKRARIRLSLDIPNPSGTDNA